MTVFIDNGQPWKQQYADNQTQTGDITGWTLGTSLPGGLAHSSAIVTKSRVYLLGGHLGSSPVSTVYTAVINSDGTLGAWEAGTSLPVTLEGSQAILTRNRVYLLGGVSLSYRNWVYTAPVDENGIIGTWSADTGLPAALGRSQAVVTKNRIYLIGGNTGAGPVGYVFTAPISEDGIIGTWAWDTSLPGVLGLGQAVVTENRVYIFGKLAAYMAPIDEEGIIGTWTAVGVPAVSFEESQAVVTENTVYFFSGIAEGAVVKFAPIDNDGIIGSWSAGTSLPAELSRSQVITTSSRIYLLGGLFSAGVVATVYEAPFVGGYNDYQDRSWEIPPFWTSFHSQTEILV